MQEPRGLQERCRFSTVAVQQATSYGPGKPPPEQARVGCAGVTRLRRKVDWQLEQLTERPLAKVDPQVLDILRLAVFELTERDMDAHAISRHVDLAALTGNRACVSFVNGAASYAVLSGPELAGRARHAQ